MRNYIRKIMCVFAVISVIIGIVEIILGQCDYNSIIVGFLNSYKYFIVACILLGLSELIGLLYDIREKI